MPQGLVIYKADGSEILNTDTFVGKFLPDSTANGSNGSAYYPELAANNGSGFAFFQYLSGWGGGIRLLIIPTITINGGTVSWSYNYYNTSVPQDAAIGYIIVGVV